MNREKQHIAKRAAMKAAARQNREQREAIKRRAFPKSLTAEGHTGGPSTFKTLK